MLKNAGVNGKDWLSITFGKIFFGKEKGAKKSLGWKKKLDYEINIC
jgi:hypothetical protein